MPAVGDLLGLSERAARDWVKRRELPVRGSRPVRVSEQAVLAAMAAEERVARNPPEVTPEPPGSSSEVPGGRPEPPGSGEPIEAAYRVAGEAAAEVALVPLATMVEELRGLAAELQEMSRRNEALAIEVGQLREREANHAGQLAAREATIAAKDQALAVDALAIGQLRWRAEAAEAEVVRQREEAQAIQAKRDRLIAAQAAPAPPHAAEGQGVEVNATDAPAGFWARVRRVFGGAQG